MKYDAMLHFFRFYSSKSRAFWVKYLGSEWCKIHQIAGLKFRKRMVTLENYNNAYAYCISGTFVSVFRDLFDRSTLICSIFHKIAEGPDSFCHHVVML